MSTYLLPSLTNFRDLGGLMTPDGRQVRADRFYRSPRLTGLTAGDSAWLDGRGIGAIVDFRGVDEARAAPIVVSPDLLGRRVKLAIEPRAGARIRQAEAQAPVTGAIVADIMIEGYRDYVRQHHETYAAFLRLLDASAVPVVFHCSAGKDRTGFAAALLLAALGVSRSQIAADYLRTNADWQPPADIGAMVPDSYRQALLGVDIAYLDAAFDVLDAEYGGAVVFAAEALGGRQALDDFRARSTEPQRG